MTVKIGDIVDNKNGFFVITEIENGVATSVATLEDYIRKNALVQEDGEWKTINEVIQRRSDLYLKSGIKIIKE